jgi:hypothetical protein
MHNRTYVRAFHGFTPKTTKHGVMGFSNGDIFRVRERSSTGDWWLACRIGDEYQSQGIWGWIPVNRVEHCEALKKSSRLWNIMRSWSLTTPVYSLSCGLVDMARNSFTNQKRGKVGGKRKHCERQITDGNGTQCERSCLLGIRGSNDLNN